jgi:two-component system, OmpR family, response regulator TctD
MAASVTEMSSWPQTVLSGRAAALVIDSDPESRRYIRRILLAAGYAFTGFADLASARAALAERRHDVVLLSLDPQREDWRAAVHACRLASPAPLFVLAENGDAAAVARVLEAKADDCLATPFDVSDLRVRIARLLRLGCRWRGMALPCGPGNLQFDLVRLRVRQGRREIGLTSLEYRTLWVLAQGNGAVLSCRDIETRVWGVDGKFHRSSLHHVVHRLRQKLAGGPPGSALLLSERRIGYRLCQPDRSALPEPARSEKPLAAEAATARKGSQAAGQP